MKEILKRAALSVGLWLVDFANVTEQTDEESDETEHLPVPPQDPLTPASRVMMYTPPVRATKAEPVALAGSAQERAEQARKRQR